ncbi:MAG: DUF6544 family protein [Candidatus Kapaibacteriota bacterium]
MDLRLILILTGIIVSFLTLALLVTLQVRRSVKKGIRALRESSIGSTSHFSIEGSIQSCPEPVRHYLRMAMGNSKQLIHFARIKQVGEFRTSPDGDWSASRADGHYLATKPGFIWKARFGGGIIPSKIAWLELLDGKGFGSVKFLGLFTLLNPSGYEADTSLLTRYLMEAIWFPTALLPSSLLRWNPINAHSAEAVLHYGSLHVSAIFEFNEQHEVIRITTEDKYRDFRSSFEKATFTLHCSNYQTFDGMRIPASMEFVWNLPKGDFSYGKYTLVHTDYEF